jgi:Transposase DDE domain
VITARRIYQLSLELIHTQSFKARHRSEDRFFTRNRDLSFGTIVSLILQKTTRSLAIEANHLGLLMKQSPVSKQAISKARHKIGVSAFRELYENALQLHYTDNPYRKWRSFRVFGGDGTTLSLPHRGDLPDFFGDHFKRTCLARVMQYTELTSDVIVSAELMPYSHSEKAMGRKMLPELVRKMRSYGEEKQIYIYDRGFPSHAFAQQHVNLGVKFLFRLQKRYCPKITERVHNRIEDSYIQEVKRGPIHYLARVIIRYLNSGEPLVLMTNLLFEEFSDEDIINLYQMRWRCEESYKFQKTVLQLDANNCRTYDGVAQEFWATVLLATMMTFLFNEEEEKEASANTKINRRVVFGSLKPIHLDAMLQPGQLESFLELFEKYCQRHRVPIRPHRSFPRLSVDTRKTRHCYRRVM